MFGNDENINKFEDTITITHRQMDVDRYDRKGVKSY
jgi:hypothetical protein